MRVFPNKSDRYLINPGKGWIVYRSFAHASEAAWEKASVGYARFNWPEIHTADRTFNWEPIDTMIDDCRTFGNWGEWHLGELGGNDPGNAVKRQYIDQWAGFDKTHVVVPISGGTGWATGSG